MRTAERRKEREREKRRQQLITGGIIAVALVVIAVFIFVVVNAPAEAPIPAAALTRYEGVEQSITSEGYPRLGDLNAPVQVVEYSSFDCPHCRDFHDTAIDRIVERVKAGNVAFTYVPLYGFGSFVNGQGAAAAAVCVAEQGKFWQFHDALFDWQGQFGNQAFTNNRISSGVDAFQLDRGAYNSCITSNRPNEILAAANAQARSLLNFTGTPTIAINGVVVLDSSNTSTSNVDTIMARIESEVARLGATTPPTAQPTTQAEPTSAATAEVTEAPAAPTEEAAASTVPTEEATAEMTPAS
jgi:protein-disulfide isomerase